MSSRDPKALRRQLIERWTGPGVAIAALVVFATLLTLFPVPGISSQLLCLHLGLDPFGPTRYPLWGLLLRTVDALAGRPPVWVFNLLSAVFGALSVWCLYILCSTYNMTRWPARDGTPRHVLRGLTSALFLTASAPMLYASSQALPHTFDLLLLLLAGLTLSRYHLTKRRGWLWLFGFLCGVGIVEYPTFLVWAPALAGATVLVMYVLRDLTLRVVLTGLLWVLVGLSFYGFAVWDFARRPGAAYMEGFTLFRIFRTILATEWRTVRYGVSQSGWLMVLLLTFLPWLVAMVVSRRRASGLYITEPAVLVHLVVGAVTLLSLFNAPSAPWRLLGPARLMLVPYVLVGACFGYIVSYLMALLRRRADFRSHRQGPYGLFVAVGAGLILGAGLIVNYPEADLRNAGGSYRCAQGLVEALDDRTMLVTDSVIDTEIWLAAREAGKSPHLLSPARTRFETYRYYMADLFPHARQTSLAQLGLLPLLRDVLTSDPAQAAKMAIQSGPDLWLSSGYTLLADRLLYKGTKDADSVDWAGLWAANARFAEEAVPALRTTEAEGDQVGNRATYLRWSLSRQLNNLGATLEGADHTQDADQAYALAFEVNPLNGFALLNRYVLQGTNAEESAYALLWDEESPVRAQLYKPLRLLVDQFGHLRRKEALEKLVDLLGLAEMAGGQSLPAELREAMQHYIGGDLDAASEQVEQIIRREPNQHQAWLFRGMLAARRGDLDRWRECWAFMEDQERMWPPFYLVEARLSLAQGDIPRALELYTQTYRLWPGNMQVLRSLALLEFQYGDAARAERYLATLLSVDPGDGQANYSLGVYQYQRGELELAESSFRTAMARNPNGKVLNNLAWVVFLQDRREEALDMARQALEASPESYDLLDTAAAILLALGRQGEAEELLDRALGVSPDRPEALLHSAQLRLDQGNESEARALMGRIKPETIEALAPELKQLHGELQEKLSEG
jgi:Tfp pilus assembly protein PilF